VFFNTTHHNNSDAVAAAHRALALEASALAMLDR
jgi:hypothetical protein